MATTVLLGVGTSGSCLGEEISSHTSLPIQLLLSQSLAICLASPVPAQACVGVCTYYAICVTVSNCIYLCTYTDTGLLISSTRDSDVGVDIEGKVGGSD